jgi:hypothetical protein
MGSTLLSEEQVQAFEQRMQTALESEFDTIQVTLLSNGKIHISKPNSVEYPWDADDIYETIETVDFTHKHSSYELVRTDEDTTIGGVDFFLQRDW